MHSEEMSELGRDLGVMSIDASNEQSLTVRFAQGEERTGPRPSSGQYLHHGGTSRGRGRSVGEATRKNNRATRKTTKTRTKEGISQKPRKPKIVWSHGG